MSESDIVLLINYLHALPQRTVPVPGRGDMEKVDEYRAIFTDAQRHFVINALRAYNPS